MKSRCRRWRQGDPRQTNRETESLSRIYGPPRAGSLSSPLTLSLSLQRLHVLGGSGKTHNLRLVATGQPQHEGSCQKAGNPLWGREGVGQGAAKKTETNYVCLMRKGSSLSSSLSEGETDMQMQHIQYSAVAKYVPA